MKKDVVMINGVVVSRLWDDGEKMYATLMDGTELVRCEKCKGWFEEDDIADVRGDALCMDCIDADSSIIYCEHCETYTYSPYGTYYVQTCYGEEGWCEDCYHDDAIICAECGEALDSNMAIWDDYNDMYYCEDCYNNRPSELIVGYHDGNPDGIQFHGEVTKDSYLQGYIGYENEFRGDGNRIAEAVYNAVGGFDFCHFEDDSTVDVEIVGQPHTLEMLYHEEDKFRAMFEAARDAGAYIHERAGLHVHFSRTCFGDTEEERAERIAKICMLFANAEAFEALAKIAQRNDYEWCNRVEGSRADIKHRANRVGGRHSTAVNLEHSATVEFRLGRSMDNWEDFIAWVEVLAWIVKKSADIEESVATCFSNWMADCPIHVMRTLNSHDVHITELATPLTVSDYEAIIHALCAEVQEAQHKRNQVLRNIGLDDYELPRVPSMQDVLARVTTANMRKGIIIG